MDKFSCGSANVSRSDAEAEERAVAPPAANVASDASRTVIRGERSADLSPTAESGGERYELRAGRRYAKIVAIPVPKTDTEPYAAITDYLNCTFRCSNNQGELSRVFARIFDVLDCEFGPAVPRRRGLHGYRESYSLGNTKGLFGIGGQRGTAFLSLPGEACALIADWEALVGLLRDEFGGRITRWDGAVDDYFGEHSVDSAVEQYKTGGFNAGGTRPSCRQNGNWIDPDGKGRTFYVGDRGSGKLARMYEKGKQLGCPESPWVRHEVEWHNKDRVIPWDVLLEPGRYVAGAYPCMAWVQETMSRIRTARKTAKIGYNVLTGSAAISYGRHINVMMEHEGSAEKVVELLRRPGVPRRLDFPLPPPSQGDA